MTFDPSRLKKILMTYETLISIRYRTEPRPAGLRLEKDTLNPHAYLEGSGVRSRQFSNHAQLRHESFLKEAEDQGRELGAFLRETMPVLDHDCLSFRLESFTPDAENPAPRFRLVIREGAASTLPARTAPEVCDMIATLHRRIGHLPRAQSLYLVNGTDVPADTGRDALRIFIALGKPDIFDAVKPKGNENLFRVSKVEMVDLADAIA